MALKIFYKELDWRITILKLCCASNKQVFPSLVIAIFSKR